MKVAWRAPRKGPIKVNVYYVHQDEPALREHNNGVGVVLRDHHGRMLWGAANLMHNLTEQQGMLWGIQVCIIHAYNMGLLKWKP